MSDYFSDRELGARPRTEQEVDPVAWAGIVAAVEALAKGSSFGASYPELCPDGQGICGNDTSSLKSAIEAEIHGLSWPLQTTHQVEQGFMSRAEPWAPPTMVALDFIEFVWRKVALPTASSHHSFFHHDHLRFDQAAGRTAFHEDVNRILARNGLGYELGVDGKVRRTLPAVLDEALRRTYFRTPDRILNAMLEESRVKFSDPDPLVRREALERLCDCWERIKTLSDPGNKQASVKAMLDQAAREPQFRAALETEARALTEFGNSYLLRHHELKQTPVIDPQHVDYLYHRLFAMVELVIRKNTA